MELFNKTNIFISFLLLIIFVSVAGAQIEDLYTAESDIFDTGKMWTFDFPPVDYLLDTYGFEPDEEWFDDVRLSALRIPGCTASFVSSNGLIMTNNHCSPRQRDKVQLGGENLSLNGFYAETLKDERKVPNMYAEQLVLIMDVTSEVNSAIDSADTDEKKIENKERVIKKIVRKYNEETGLKCQVVSLYNGGKYSVYGYKRFEDVRLVYVPEDKIGYFGGDLDNFTYPRYNLDCAFFRIYDNDGNPLESNNFFKFSSDGVQRNEVIFSVGNPGRTNRLHTVSQLEYNRDLTYRNRAFLRDEYYNLLEKYKSEYPERADEFEKLRIRIGNGQKVYHYALAGLKDPYLIARKRDFENKLISKISENPKLHDQYSHVWESIENLREELKPVESKLAAFSQSRYSSSAYFNMASKIIDFAEQMNRTDYEKGEDSRMITPDSLLNDLFSHDFDPILENIKLEVQLDYIKLNLGEDHELVEILCGELSGRDATEALLDKSQVTTKEKLASFLKNDPQDILNSDDPIIYFVKNTRDEIGDLIERSREILATENILVNMLGRVLFDIYGTQIPPDANFTLRLSDGVLESFDYNGTIAIETTTFYGMYDRYYGSDKTYPWKLPPRWEKPPEGLDLSTIYNFISTNDIIGGNSGSAVINKDAEVVGLAFDGNITSIIGDFIFLPEDNRMVSVASQAILEALDKVYNATRIVEELRTRHITK